ncbi:MAG TPA: metalloregulator ArsR/SmtB family transcription factor [Gemmataceae bacterium]|nr:metalloregulator ArsR/SmtB family transcription factor [Gemmataceae bacterium]
MFSYAVFRRSFNAPVKYYLRFQSSSAIFHIMVNYSRSVDTVFAALADATRRGILIRLGQRGESPVTALAKPFQISLPAISRHLRVLERARLIERRRVGRTHLIRARSGPLKRAQSWLASCAAAWDYQFDALEEFLRNDKDSAPGKEHRK